LLKSSSRRLSEFRRCLINYSPESRLPCFILNHVKSFQNSFIKVIIILLRKFFFFEQIIISYTAKTSENLEIFRISYSGNNDFEPGAGLRESDAWSHRGRTESMPFQIFMNYIWFNIQKTTHGTDSTAPGWKSLFPL